MAHVALHLQYLKISKSAVEEAVHAIAWVHFMAGIPSPTSSPFIHSIVEGMKRELAMSVHKKFLMTIEILKAIVGDTKRNVSLVNIQLASACLLAFAGFLRFDELANIKVCDLSFSPYQLTIQIPRRKSDQLRHGSEVVIARTDAETCPVSMLKTYMKKGSIQRSSEGYLFHPIASAKFSKLRWRSTGSCGVRSHLRKKPYFSHKSNLIA